MAQCSICLLEVKSISYLNLYGDIFLKKSFSFQIHLSATLGGSSPNYRLKSLSDWLIIGTAGFWLATRESPYNFLATICFPLTNFRLTNDNFLRFFLTNQYANSSDILETIPKSLWHKHKYSSRVRSPLWAEYIVKPGVTKLTPLIRLSGHLSAISFACLTNFELAQLIILAVSMSSFFEWVWK